MTDAWLALLGHLRHAADSYGGDLPLAGLGPGPLVTPRAPTGRASRRAAVEAPRRAPSTRGSTDSTRRRPASRRPRTDPPPAKILRPATSRPTIPRDVDADPAERLAALREAVLPCTKCKLRQGARQVVFGEGSPTARVMFVGEAPGQVEDETGRPFVGRSGELLDKIIEGAMGLRREDVFIANINKCRPPGNRDPEPLEIASCLPWLRTQIEIIRPEVIVTLGRVAMWNLLGITDSMGRMRGRQLDYEGIPVVPTWHPAYLLRTPSAKRDTWEDIKRVNRLLGEPEDPNREKPASG